MGYGWRLGDLASSGVLSVPTAQALRDYSVTDLAIVGPVQTLSAIAVSARGGAIWRYVDGAAPGTYVDDVGSTLVPTGGDGSAAWLNMLEDIDIRMFGALGNDLSDDTEAINCALAWSGSTRRTIHAPRGIYRTTSRLILTDRCHLKAAPNAVFRRNFIGASSHAAALFGQTLYTTKINDVSVEGGIYDVVDSDKTGKVFCLNGDNISLHRLDIQDYYGGQGILISGDRNRVSDCSVVTPSNAAGTGAIRMMGGHDFLCSDCYARCGDDCFQFVPGADSGENGGVDIVNGAYVNCIGYSETARVAVVSLATSGNGPCSSQILNVAFTNVLGTGGGAGLAITATDQGETNTIDGVTFVNCQVSAPRDYGSSVNAIDISTGDYLPVRNISIMGCVLRASVHDTVDIRGVDGLLIENCVIEAPITSGNKMVRLFGNSSRVKIFGCLLRGNGDCQGIYLGESSECSSVDVVGNDILGLSNTAWGISASRVNVGLIKDNRIAVRTPASFTGVGLRVASTSLYTGVVGNDLRQIGGYGTPLIMSGTGNWEAGNRGIGARSEARGTAVLSGGTATVVFAEAMRAIPWITLTSQTPASGQTFWSASRTASGFSIMSSDAESNETVAWSAWLGSP